MSKNLNFLTLFFIFSISILKAQKFEVGLTVGTSNYTGDIDIVPQNLNTATRLGIGLLAKYHFSDKWRLRGQLLVSRLSGSEKTHPTAWRQERGFLFATRYSEMSAILERDIMQIRRFSVYAFGGLGANFYSPLANLNLPNPYVAADAVSDIQITSTRTTLVLPMGVGVKYALKNNFYLSAEMAYRKTFTDYLDGISQAANPNRVDGYFFTGISLTKGFGSSKNAANRMFKQGDTGCPTF